MECQQIKDIFLSTPGKRLIAAMLLIQPISSSELQHFLPLVLKVFKPGNYIDAPFPMNDWKKDNYISKLIDNTRFSPVADGKSFIPNGVSYQNLDALQKREIRKQLQKRETKEQLCFKKMFNDRDFGEKGIISKAEKCGLITGIPKRKGGKKPKYYFLNSDLKFIITPYGFKVELEENSFFKKINFDNHTKQLYKIKGKKKRERKEWASLPANKHDEIYFKEFFPISQLLTWIEWIIKYPEEIKDFKELWLKNAEIKKQDFIGQRRKREIWKRAIRDGIIWKKEPGIYEINLVGRYEFLSFNLTRSYEILRAFSNFSDMTTKISTCSPMKLLKLLTSQQYEIIPEKRPLCFTSITGEFTKTYLGRVFFVNRNTQLLKDIFLTYLGNYISPRFFDELIESKYSIFIA